MTPPGFRSILASVRHLSSRPATHASSRLALSRWHRRSGGRASPESSFRPALAPTGLRRPERRTGPPSADPQATALLFSRPPREGGGEGTGAMFWLAGSRQELPTPTPEGGRRRQGSAGSAAHLGGASLPSSLASVLQSNTLSSACRPPLSKFLFLPFKNYESPGLSHQLFVRRPFGPLLRGQWKQRNKSET